MCKEHSRVPKIQYKQSLTSYLANLAKLRKSWGTLLVFHSRSELTWTHDNVAACQHLQTFGASNYLVCWLPAVLENYPIPRSTRLILRNPSHDAFQKIRALDILWWRIFHCWLTSDPLVTGCSHPAKRRITKLLQSSKHVKLRNSSEPITWLQNVWPPLQKNY